MQPREICELEERMGYPFRDRALLRAAVTHASFINEHALERTGCNERLEFLGDSVLGFLTAEFLYEHEPAIPEGRMTRLRAELVCEQSLYGVAKRLGISGNMRLGRAARAEDGQHPTVAGFRDIQQHS